VNVLLIGNYAPDRQESMQRFAAVLAKSLPEHGINANCVCPPAVFGRLRPGTRGIGKWLGYLDKFVMFPRRLRRIMRNLPRNTVVHICDHSNAAYTSELTGIPHLVTCHDLLAVRSALGEFPQCSVRATGRFFQKWILRGINQAERVACVSTATHRDLLRLTTLTSEKVSTVYNGQNYSYEYLPEVEITARLREFVRGLTEKQQKQLAAGFILHVGGNQWYKNRAGVIQIYAKLRSMMPNPPNLVMVGKAFTSAMREQISSLGLEEHVFELNSVSNEDLNALYGAAQLLLFPSIEEGFGWPIIEAQASGCPVVAANREPMSEVGGEAASYFDFERNGTTSNAPLSEQSVTHAAAVCKSILLEAADIKQKRRRNGLANAARFSTARMIDGYIKLYQRALKLEPKSRALEIPTAVAA